MSTYPPDAANEFRPDAAVTRIHHVGHVVRDLQAAMTLYRRMGFVVPPPAFPALEPRPGEPPHAFGAGNTHLYFRHSFVELVTVVDEEGLVEADAILVPLQVSAEARDRLADNIARTAGRISDALDRFEGLHILVLGTADAEATIARLAAHGVVSGAVSRIQRPVETGAQTKQVSIGFVEIDSEPGLSPEGRLALAEDGPADSATPLAGHPNGAVELVESVLCVADVELGDYEHRYARYLQRKARSDGPLRIFDLNNSRVMIVPYSALGEILPGESPPDLPAFVAYGVAVQDLSATRDLVKRAEFPVRRAPFGGFYVPAAAALGAAIIFRSE
jgi:hypothetical protein